VAKATTLRVLVASDGSHHARAAVATARYFPWPARTRVRVVVARSTPVEYKRSILLTALDRSSGTAAENARRALSRRWPDVEAIVVDETPIAGILREADRFRAHVIVVGWRGHGVVRRFLMGSVSRGIVRRAKCAVLVVRRSRQVRRIVLGLDGSAMAKRALALTSSFVPPPDGRVTLVTAVNVMAVPSHALLPGRPSGAREGKEKNASRNRAARRELSRAAAQLKTAGWDTRTVLTNGEPLADLLGTIASVRSQLLVLGAKGTSGVRRLLLGSVAEGALNRSPVPVLVAR